MQRIFIEKAVCLCGYNMNERCLAGVTSLSLFFTICEHIPPPQNKKKEQPEYSSAPVIFHVDDCPHLNDEANNWQ